MDWTALIWLGLGLGMGLSIRWRSPRLSVVESTALPDCPMEPDQPELQSLQVAYQLATEISQFKGGFLARISHELRSPLNGLIGMQQLILEDLCDNPEEERAFIAQANQSALKMIKVLDTVLDVARLEHGRLNMEIQPLQLAELLQTIHDLTYLQAVDRSLQLQVILPEADLYVLADPHRLQRVLLHLVDGTLAQMQEGSVQISVSVAPDSISSDSMSSEMGYAHIWIDSDPPPALSEPIDLLQTPADTTTPVPSPGLNLLTSQMLVSLMQGTLTVLALPTGAETPAHEVAPQRLRMQCSLPLVEADEE
ncbi:sensor histidine kinase [Phormidium sp. FACHB-592]|uniref:histidine kinase n=1 Tax=Stenomitos frigidus AS-A4 TaxID=2933935 RepID=A0ABV0KNB8_9CYAN|nr:HAMP domain-containing sensor histidine kinase [Phormidium sp. FACHB-592]MBD2073144.1 sensor histidine kinase [Phormidium sp. FACHB-592]